MAKVLVVDDRPINRELVVTVLAHRGHQAIEASDGAEGLKLVRAENPDLVICDILMPTMDGFEFVRQLRSDPRHRQTQVIFYTAHYHEREARNLAKSCGVARIIAKPSEPEEMLAIIDDALAQRPPGPAQPIAPEFDRDHLRIMTDKLAQKVDELKAMNERLKALTEAGVHLASERDPHRLLDHMCRSARELAGAKYGLLCVKSKTDTGTTHFASSGFDPGRAKDLACPAIDSGVLGQVMLDWRSRRLSRGTGDPMTEALPAEYPAPDSLLASPIASLKNMYGWICLVDKVGAQAFTEEDEQLLSTHAAQVGRIYENGSLYVQVERHATKLREEIAERERAETKVRHLNRVYAVLSGINTLIVRVRDRDELFRRACEIAVDVGKFTLSSIFAVDGTQKQLVPVAWRGADEAFIRRIPTGLDPSAANNYGIMSRAVVEKKVVIVDDVATDPRLVPRRDTIALGIGSLAALPLKRGDEVVAAMTLCAAEPGFFDADEMKLLHELAGDLSFSLENIAREEQLQYLAYYDTLTGLANATLFRDRLEQFILGAKREHRPLGVAILCVDHFRAINESSGRHAGDRVLREIAARLVKVSTSVECARLTADRFAVALPTIRQEADAAHRVEAIHDALFGDAYDVDGSSRKLFGRAGLALYPTDGNEPDTLLRHAEEALKRAKSSGDHSLFYAQDMSQRVAERLGLESRLRQALENDEFVLHYQPKVDLSTRAVQGVEALIRWQSPERGLVPPGEFISLLEETGLIREVGLWAVRRAVSDQQRWSAQNLAVPRVAVNVSAVQLRQRDFVDALKSAVANGQSGAPAIDIEITESLIMDDVGGTIEKLKMIRDMGVGIAIDDFGTGYSSLGYLTRLPVHSLKIDRSFIVTMTDDPDTMAIVSTIISLAHSLALKVTAEGVETEEQARVLRLFRCDEMQGYLISRPVPAPALVPFLGGDGS